MNIERNESEEYGGNGEHATLYATNSSQRTATMVFTSVEDQLAALRVHDLPTFKRDEQPLNTGHSHPCSNPELGEFISSDQELVIEAAGIKKYATVFHYQYGAVILDSDWKWHTVIAKKLQSPDEFIGDSDNYRDYLGMIEKVAAITHRSN